jgi:hypothetical protein
MFKALILAVHMMGNPQAVEMPAYQVEQIIWYQYYGEWAPSPGDTDDQKDAATKKAAKKDTGSK